MTEAAVSDDVRVLAARAASGDQQAAERLIMEFVQPLIWPLLKSHLPQEADVNDVSQLVLMAVSKKWGLLADARAVPAPKGWVLGIAANEVSLFYRKRRSKGLGSTGRLEATDESDCYEVVDVQDTLEHLLMKLDPTNRKILLMRLQGTAREGIAQELGLSFDALKRSLVTIRQTAQQLFDR